MVFVPDSYTILSDDKAVRATPTASVRGPQAVMFDDKQWPSNTANKMGRKAKDAAQQKIAEWTDGDSNMKKKNNGKHKKIEAKLATTDSEASTETQPTANADSPYSDDDEEIYGFASELNSTETVILWSSDEDDEHSRTEVTKDKHTILIYLETIPVNTKDFLCLGSGQYLNDVIIDFYLGYLKNEVLNEEQKARTYINVFSAFFYNNTLANKKRASCQKGELSVDVKIDQNGSSHPGLIFIH